ncbi:MAG: CBS domain-containing protein [Pontiellaceae bacterium]|jgi:CBS domain-containing protein|nr:CBS domain-containing protein [Pontiellaceae bacterium]
MGTVGKLLEKKGKELVCASPGTSIRDVIAKMAEKAVGTALVMDGEKLVGILSERDFIRKIYLKDQCGKGVKVNEIMSTNLTTVSADTTLESCMNLMTDKRIRHLPVMNKDRVVGIVSIGDIIKYMVSEKDFLIKNLQEYISGPGM